MTASAALAAFAQDVLYAVRGLRKSPGLVVTAALSLGLGIGVNQTIFNLFNILVLAKPTAAEPERLVRIEPGNGNGISYPNYRDLGRVPAFGALALTAVSTFNLGGAGAMEQATGLTVSDNYFEFLGISPPLGRGFRPRETQVAVISYDFWQSRFAGDPGAIGHLTRLNGQSYTIIGILGRDFRAGQGALVPALYTPLSQALSPALADRAHPAFSLQARLAPGVTRPQAQAAFRSAAQALETQYPRDNKGFGRPPLVVPVYGIESLRSGAAPAQFYAGLAVPFVVVGILLLIACANVAGVMLARGAMRQREIAIRLALGASRGRLVQTLLAEALLLSLAGAGGGLLLTAWFTPWLSQVRLPGAPAIPVFNLQPDLNMALYSLAAAVATCIFCGLVPAFQSTRPNILPWLKQTALQGASARSRLRKFVVCGQVAASVLLLMTGLLFLRSLWFIGTVNPGFDIDRGITARITPEQNAVTPDFAERMARRAEAVPGVVSVSYASLIPLGGDVVGTRAEFAGRPDFRSPQILAANVGPQYFATLRIPVVRGREFDRRDRPGSPPVAIVNEAFARVAFPGGANPIGKLVRTLETEGPWREIVGVTANNNYKLLGEPPQPQLFLPFLQTGGRLFLQLRTAGQPAASLAAVKRAIAEEDGSALSEVRTTREATSFEFAFRRVATALLASMGALGLLLAMVGLYGVLSWDVSRRTAEIGIRMALGASAGAVRRMVVRDAFVLTAIGIAAGVSASLLATLPLRSFLTGTGTADPVAIAAVAAILTLVAGAASWFPVRRATRVSPLTALRYD